MANETFAYPFDGTGNAASNSVVAEAQIISPPNFKDFYFVVPKFAPFYRSSLVVRHAQTNRILQEGIDYDFTHHFSDASLKTALPIYGSFTLLDKTLAGVLILSYQTVGGRWTLSTEEITAILSNASLNPRVTTWDQITSTPVTFPPIDHEWDVVDLVGMSEVTDKLTDIKDALLAGGEASSAAHVADLNNPHATTKAQVGLGSVENFPISSKAEAETGISNTVYMTPLRVKEAIATQANGTVSAHIADLANPHAVTASQIGLGNVQNYPMATKAESESGSSAVKYMSPLGTKQAIDMFAGNVLTGHINDTSNPHDVTAAQVGLGNVQNYGIASTINAQAGTSDLLYMTPLKVKQAIDIFASLLLEVHADNTNNPHNVTSEQLGVYTKTVVDNLLDTKANKTDVAPNSLQLEGKTVADIIATVQASTVSNATTLEGKSVAQIVADARNGKSADSALLDGFTRTEIVEQAAGTLAASLSYPESIGIGYMSTPGITYQRLITGLFKDVAVPDEGLADIVFLITGTETKTNTVSSVQLVTVSRRIENQIDVLNLNNNPTTTEFGLVMTPTNVDIWMKMADLYNSYTFTILSKNNSIITVDEDPVTVEPAGIFYATPQTIWRTDNFDPSSKLAATATAVNSSKLENKTLAEVTATILTGTAANATLFDNQLPSYYATAAGVEIIRANLQAQIDQLRQDMIDMFAAQTP